MSASKSELANRLKRHVHYINKIWTVDSDEWMIEITFRGHPLTARHRSETRAMLLVLDKLEIAMAEDTTKPSMSVD